MKICRSTNGNQSGVAVLVVLTLLAIMTVYVVGNGTVLLQLKRELRMIEQKQLSKYGPGHAGARNATNQSQTPPKP